MGWYWKPTMLAAPLASCVLVHVGQLANGLGMCAAVVGGNASAVLDMALQGDLDGPQLQCTRMEVSGGPVFSLLRGIKTKVTDVNVKPRDPVLFCGLAAKEISALHPDTLTFSQQVSALSTG